MLTAIQYPVIHVNWPSREDRWTPRASPYQVPSPTGSATYFPERDSGGTVPSIIKTKKKKGKQKQGVPTKAGEPTSPGGTPRPGVQVANKPDIDDTNEFDASRGIASPQSPGGTGQAISHSDETQHWEEEVQPVSVSPRYDVEGVVDDFNNVWGGTSRDEGPSERQKHL